ncbi:MAG: transcriptional regulator [Desulfobacterales bacterium]|nr:MAG: transcriptional regulator [Desulfobacterales bacterium]
MSSQIKDDIFYKSYDKNPFVFLCFSIAQPSRKARSDHSCYILWAHRNNKIKIRHPTINILKSIPLFSGLSQDQLRNLSDRANKVDFRRGEMIFQEGDRATGFYIVATGKIKVFKLSLEGKEQILHIYGPGHTFGEVPVFEGKNFPASAMALAPSQIIFLPRDAFVELISAYPALALAMLADLSKRLRAFTIQIENLSLKEVPARLAAYILTLAHEKSVTSGKLPDKVTLPISKAQLANLIGTTPETVSRILKKMGEANLITVAAKDILIHDSDGLCELSDMGRL